MTSGATRMNARSADADWMLYLRPFQARAEHQRDLLEVVDEELLRLFVEVADLARPPNASAANSFFSSCASGACATRPRPTPSSLISS